MGVDFTSLDLILRSLKYVKTKTNVLTLGRQSIYVNSNGSNYMLHKHGIHHMYDKLVHVYGYSEVLFENLGFGHVDSLDCSDGDSPTIVHDMNKPLYNDAKKYDFIFDGGTTEHVYNQPQCHENIIDLLEVGGIYCASVPNNNYSGHGIYQFSPEFFLSTYREKYGMEVRELYIAQHETEHKQWKDVNNFNEEGDGRNITKFCTDHPVVINVIAQKISNDRKSLITDSPQQFSYDRDWKKRSEN